MLEAGKPHRLMVIAPGHQRRIQAGILSWGQDMDHETVPFQCNLAYQVPRKKRGDYIGRAALERDARRDRGRQTAVQDGHGGHEAGRQADRRLCAPDFWLVSDAGGGDPIGYLTSPWHAPEIGCNIALGYVPLGKSAVGTELRVWLPDDYASEPGRPGPRLGVRGPFPSIRQPERPRAGARPRRRRGRLVRLLRPRSGLRRSCGAGAKPFPRAPAHRPPGPGRAGGWLGFLAEAVEFFTISQGN